MRFLAVFTGLLKHFAEKLKKLYHFIRNILYFYTMQQNRTIKILTIMLAMLCMEVVVASSFFTGIIEENAKNKKYSLNNLNRSTRSFSLFSLKNNFSFAGSSVMQQKIGVDKTVTNTMMKFEKGNTTYIIPYNYKVKVSKIKSTQPTITIKL
jgi:hypothetical protein